MKNTKKGVRVPVSSIPQVQELVDLQMEIEALKAQHPDVFLAYQDLVDRYNAALEVAEAAVREKEVSCGPFDNFSMAVKYNPAKMFDELGEEKFLQCGGKTSMVTQYTVDPKQVEAAIASKKIPEECVDQFIIVERKYHKPQKRIP